MLKKVTALILALLLGFLMISCAAATARKHLNQGETLEKQGAQLEANKEFIRALKGIADKKVRGELCTRIANNYRRAHRYDDAIKYYKEAIGYYNYFSLPAPYMLLAETYIASGQTGAASALLKELEADKPEDYIIFQTEIARLLGGWYMRKNEWSQAEFYYLEFQKYAKQKRNMELVDKADRMLKIIKMKKEAATIKRGGGEKKGK